eukprot:9678-Heterococcus_DN1.PRE.1
MDWTCPRCTYANSDSDDRCIMCSDEETFGESVAARSRGRSASKQAVSAPIDASASAFGGGSSTAAAEPSSAYDSELEELLNFELPGLNSSNGSAVKAAPVVVTM